MIGCGQAGQVLTAWELMGRMGHFGAHFFTWVPRGPWSRGPNSSPANEQETKMHLEPFDRWLPMAQGVQGVESTGLGDQLVGDAESGRPESTKD